MKIRSITLALALTSTLAPGVALAARSKPIRTGQTMPRGAVGDTTAGVARHYVDLGDAWVEDRRTGLWWEKKTDDGGLHDHGDAYTWSVGSGMADGTAFTAFLAALNTQPCFGGHCDWRLPTSTELYSLVDIGFSTPAVGPFFDAGCLPGCTIAACNCTSSDGYWTSSTPKGLDGFAWIVEFGNGAVILGDKTASYHVRAVRSDKP